MEVLPTTDWKKTENSHESASRWSGRVMRFREKVSEALMVVRQEMPPCTPEEHVFVSPASSCEFYDIGDDGDEETTQPPRAELGESTTTTSRAKQAKKRRTQVLPPIGPLRKTELSDYTDKYWIPTAYPAERMTTKDIRSAIHQYDVELQKKRGMSAGPFT